MKLFKVLVLVLLSVFLTGCYTQLQVSRSMQAEEGGEAVTQSHEKKQKSPRRFGDMYYRDNGYYGYMGDIYQVGRINNCYGFYDYDSYRRYWRPYSVGCDYFAAYPNTLYFGPDFYGTRFTFAIGWGSPFFYRTYDPFWYRGYSYGYYYGLYGNFGSPSPVVYSKSSNIRYGPRNIGANRTDATVNRSREGRVSSRTATVKSKSTVRVRNSVGSSRTRHTVTKRSDSTNGRNRGSRGTVTGDSKSRNGDSDQRTENINRHRNNQTIFLRSRSLGSRSLGSGVDIERRLRQQMAPKVVAPRNNQRGSSSFFGKVKKFLNSGTTRNRDHYNWNIKFRSSSKNGSAVKTRSRSSSVTKSRSRGSSSRSRSGGDGKSSSSSSSRSRGNN